MVTLIAVLLVVWGAPQVVIPGQPAAAADPAVAAALEPVKALILQEQERQSNLPEPHDDGERLVRMGRLDQLARRAVQTMSTEGLTPTQASAAKGRALGLMFEIDQENQRVLSTMNPVGGWFTREQYGPEASQAAFLIVQHSDEALMKRFLPALEPLVGTGQISDADYALMYDRVAVDEGRPQRYGSQWICRGRVGGLADLEEPDTVDQRRAAMGMSTLAENNARLAARGNLCLMNPE